MIFDDTHGREAIRSREQADALERERRAGIEPGQPAPVNDGPTPQRQEPDENLKSAKQLREAEALG